MAYKATHYVHRYRGRRFFILRFESGCWYWLEDGNGNELSQAFVLKRDAIASASNRVDLDLATPRTPKKSLKEFRRDAQYGV